MRYIRNLLAIIVILVLSCIKADDGKLDQYAQMADPEYQKTKDPFFIYEKDVVEAFPFLKDYYLLSDMEKKVIGYWLSIDGGGVKIRLNTMLYYIQMVIYF